MVTIGLEALAADPRRWLAPGARLGLLCNSASVDRGFRAARDLVAELPGCRLVALFGPQHGIRCDVQDNMRESPHGTDPRLGIPVWSLYSHTRVPDPAMLQGLDVLLVDLQDVGTRVYTFIWTLRLAMEACGRAGVKVLVLDRPNPLGGAAVEGNLLQPAWRSFVGLDALPMRHGLTVGELARWFLGRGAPCDLAVVPLQGWRRPMTWAETGRPWVMPSPNMPTADTAAVYPGTVLLEGTTASEGRGTTRPFEVVGGPWVEPDAFATALAAESLPGVAFRPVEFLPTFQKWAGVACGGVQLHVTEPGRFLPYRTGLAVLGTLWRHCRAAGFGWTQPPYEYEHERLPIHLLLGDDRVREGLEAGTSPRDLEALWAEELVGWDEERRGCFLYRA